MPERRSPLTPHELTELLAKLDEVMAEALRLREVVSRQLGDQRRAQQQRMSTPRNPGVAPPKTKRRR